MSFLNGFLDNLASGALNPKGTLGDFQHAARMFVDDSHRLTPKVKFLYHVTFNINPDVTAVIPQLRQKHMNELNMLVKTAQLPAYNIQTDIKHQYNRKRVVQKRIDYQPVQISFHDDTIGITIEMATMLVLGLLVLLNQQTFNLIEEILSTVPSIDTDLIMIVISRFLLVLLLAN